MNRRDFVTSGLGALGSILCLTHSKEVWANTPLSGWLNAFKDQQGRYGVAHIRHDLSVKVLFYTPNRLHGMDLSPDRRFIVAPSRRPGTEIYVHDLYRRNTQVITAPEGRHFYGHGVFSENGERFYATENAYDEERGVIGIYDVRREFTRLAEFDSNGIGPHEIKRIGHNLIIANGGILTHPNTGRSKLNLDSMAPNVTILDSQNGNIQNIYRLDNKMHMLSMRHMDCNAAGDIFIGLQDQDVGINEAPLVWKIHKGQISPLPEPEDGWQIFKGYVGSVSCSDATLCVTSPRGNVLHRWGQQQQTLKLDDICAVHAAKRKPPFITTGKGFIQIGTEHQRREDLHFDNHCIAL